MTEQTPTNRADLVLEGGGVKGIALVGALSVLEERGYTFPRIAGTSAGSIVGALLAAGRTTAELHDLMRSTDFRSFEDVSAMGRLPLLGKPLSVLRSQGIYLGEAFRQWLLDALPPTHRTFADLRLPPDPHSTLAPEQRYRLVVMSSDVSERRIARLPWDYASAYRLVAQEQQVVDAVRASMSIPFFFRPAQLRHGPDPAEPDGAPGRSTMVDGGMLSNFPVEVFDRQDGAAPRWPTFGIKLSGRPGQQRFPEPTKGPFSLGLAMISTMTSWYDGMHIDRPDVLARTIFVDTLGISSTAFGLSAADQDRLFASGREAAERFLAGWDFQDYVRRFRSPARPAEPPPAAGPVPSPAGPVPSPAGPVPSPAGPVPPPAVPTAG